MDASDITVDRTCCCDRFIDKYLLYIGSNNVRSFLIDTKRRMK